VLYSNSPTSLNVVDHAYNLPTSDGRTPPVARLVRQTQQHTQPSVFCGMQYRMTSYTMIERHMPSSRRWCSANSLRRLRPRYVGPSTWMVVPDFISQRRATIWNHCLSMINSKNDGDAWSGRHCQAYSYERRPGDAGFGRSQVHALGLLLDFNTSYLPDATANFRPICDFRPSQAFLPPATASV